MSLKPSPPTAMGWAELLRVMREVPLPWTFLKGPAIPDWGSVTTTPLLLSSTTIPYAGEPSWLTNVPSVS